jgi:undecaprenyl diphosphate synthase
MKAPNHLAVVMDGNGRWAKERHLHRADGHRAGKEALKKIVAHCMQRNIPHLSVFAFSSENWRRPTTEVSAILHLFEAALSQESKELAERGVRLKMVGDLSKFSLSLRQMIHLAESKTANNHRLILTVAVNYGGRWDIVQAGEKVAKAGLEFTEENYAKHLAFAHLPDPDLIIRTGGEKRLSNFMLWQAAYAEIYFSEVLWPLFTPEALDMALQWFAGRERRFGMTSEQIHPPSSPTAPQTFTPHAPAPLRATNRFTDSWIRLFRKTNPHENNHSEAAP